MTRKVDSALPTRRPVVAHIDGASRGNPGPSSFGIYVVSGAGDRPLAGWGFLGEATNNVAEYTALVRLLEWARESGVEALDVRSDSELLVKQMLGSYRVKAPTIVPLYGRARILATHLETFRISHVRRESNRQADRLANHALDTRSESPIGPVAADVLDPESLAAPPAKCAVPSGGRR